MLPSLTFIDRLLQPPRQRLDRLLQPPRARVARDFMPSIRQVDFLRRLAAGGVPADHLPLARTLVGDLLLTWVRVEGDGARLISESTCAALNIDEDTLAEEALRALAARTERDPWRISITEADGLHRLSTQGFPASSLLADPAFWDEQCLRLGPLVMAVPHRDVVLFGAQRDERSLPRLQQALEDADFVDPDALSDRIFCRDGGGLYLWED